MNYLDDYICYAQCEEYYSSNYFYDEEELADLLDEYYACCD